MKLTHFLILIIFITTTLNASITNNLHVGISISKQNEAQQRKIKSVLKKIIIEVNKFFDEEIFIEIIPTEKDVVKEFENFKKINVIIIYPNVYLEHLDVLKKNSKNLFVLSGADQLTQYYLIANKKSKIKRLKDLRNKSFISFNGNNNYVDWLDYITRRNLKIKYDNLISKETISNKETKLIYNTYFNKTDFTVISKKIYDDMVILNPSIKKSLIIIEKSEPIFINAVGLVHKNTPKKIVTLLNKILFNKDFEYAFSDILKLLNDNTMKRIDIKELKDLENFYHEYMRLKGF